MRYFLVLLTLLSVTILNAAPGTVAPAVEAANVETVTPDVVCVHAAAQNCPREDMMQEPVLKADKNLIISVIGQGVAPMKTATPAQAYAMAKRAAIADAYRLIAEKVKGVRVDGKDLIKNMMVKRSTIRTAVVAMVRSANVVETNFKDGLCEVEMEIEISHSQFQ